MLILPSSPFRPAEGGWRIVRLLGPCLPGSAIGCGAGWRCRSRRAATPWRADLLREKNRNLKSSKKICQLKNYDKVCQFWLWTWRKKRPYIFSKIWILQYLFKFLLFLLSVRSTKAGCGNTKMQQLESRVGKLLSKIQWMEMNEKGEQNRNISYSYRKFQTPRLQ